MDLRSRASLRPRSYEDFQPQFQWVREEGSDTLRFDLSGFKKEQLKVRIDNHGNLTVSGERPLDGNDNRWSRFSKEFRVPENCNAKEIRAKFDSGLLNVIMPKIAARSESKDQPSKAQEIPANDKPAAESKPATGRKEKSQKASTDAAAAKKPEPVDAGKDKRKVEEKEEDHEGKAHADDTKVTRDTKEREKIKSEVKEREEKVSKVSADDQNTSEETGMAEEAGRRVLGKSKYGLGLKKPRLLVANIVVSVIVIVGLGIYFTYELMKKPEMDNN